MEPNAALALFGLQQFRPPQGDIVLAVLQNRDVAVVMPTGGGKSLTYQLPAVCRPGFTVVVSPLISLMHNQVAALARRNIEAVAITSECEAGRADRLLAELARGESEVKLLYVAPERVTAPSFMALLRACYAAGHLQRFAIDECHCVVQWGEDFRPEYSALGMLRQQMPSVPIMVLTASATAAVLEAIETTMGLRSPAHFRASFNRANLRYSVVPKTANVLGDMFTRLISLNLLTSTGIIYCFRTADCDDVATQLNSRFARHDPAAAAAGSVFAAAYHAKMEGGARADVQRRWTEGRVRVVVATIAFGMGIDKPDVRYVFHHTMPKTMEGYYQESGRAGRDGAPAHCILYYASPDYYALRGMLSNTASTNKNRVQRGFQPISDEVAAKTLEALDAMRDYCQSRRCRRVLQLAHFGMPFSAATCGSGGCPCDICGASQRSILSFIGRKRPINDEDDD